MRKTTVLAVYVSVLLLSALFGAPTMEYSITGVSAADPPSVYVYPPTAVISAPGEYVTIEVRVANVTDLYGWNLFVGYNTTLLEYQNMTVTGTNQCVHGTFGMDYLWYEKTPPVTSNDTVACIMGFWSRPSFNASGSEYGVLCWLTFKGKAEGVSDIYLSPHPAVPEVTQILDDSSPAQPIPHTQVDGEIVIGAVHDVAVIGVVPSVTEVYEGDLVNIDVTVRNEGTATETFEVSTYYDSILIDTLQATSLGPETERTLTFTWTTSGVPEGNYTISAVASTLFGETDTADNTKINGIVTIRERLEYTLTIYSSPTGVTFTVDGVSRTTPWSGTYSEGASVSLVMPGTHDGYVWSHWLEDGDPNRIKTVTMDTNITLTGVFTYPLLPIVSVYPPLATISAPGETVTVEVRVAYVTDLYGFEVYIGFNTTLLEFVSMSATGTDQVVHGTKGVDYSFTVVEPPTVSSDVVVGVCGFLTAPSFNASGADHGVLVWVTFKGKTVGVSTLDLSPHPEIGETTIILDSMASEIPSTLIDGEIKVKPKFLSIQAAIDAANPGDTIEVPSGIYYEHVVVNKPLTLVGEDKSTTIIDGNGTGIVIRINAPDVEIKGFTLQNAGDSPNSSIHLGGCIRNTICNNIIRNSAYGISLVRSNDSIIVGNKIMNNSDVGIHIRDSSNNIIHYNTIANNHMGVFITSEFSLFNTFHHNNFIDNYYQACSFAPTTKWDDGGGKGNYWSDYTGDDDGSGGRVAGDGVGDTLLPHQGVDWYPLMEPVRLRLLGDVNDDGVVDGSDIILLGPAILKKPGQPGYTPYADLSGDGRIDAVDIIILGRNLGKSYC